SHVNETRTIILKPLPNPVIIHNKHQQQTTKTPILLTHTPKQKSNQPLIIPLPQPPLLHNPTQLAPQLTQPHTIVFQQY
ncbi:hypothetical protein, partial [Staphylococcus epidermidis]|uniref:hypothetical protein n=1 Tax=Staphylococcus epidermidis TaxID=1282 RepID=UPI0011A8B495